MSLAGATPLRILHVEDVPADAELAERELVKAGIGCETRRVETREAFLAALAEFVPDLILSDYRLPTFNGMQALLLAKEHSPDVPVIITTGSVNEETAVACMKAGAADYVLKDHLGRLGTAVRSALERQRLLAEGKRAEVRIRQLNRLLKTISEINQLIVRTEEKEKLLPEACRILVEHGGFTMAWVGLADRGKGLVLPAAWAGKASYYLDQITVRLDDTPDGRGPVGTAVRTGRHVVVADIVTEPTVAAWRERMLVHGFRTLGAFPFRVRGTVAGTLTVYAAETGTIGDEEMVLLDELSEDLGYALETLEIRDEHGKVEEALRESEERFKSLFENALLGLYRTTPDGSVLMANPCLCRMLGYDSFEELKSRNLEEEGFEPSYPRSEFRRKLEEEGVVLGQESSWRRRDGSFVFVRESATAIRDGSGKVLHYEGTVEDITQRKGAEEALRGSQKTLRALLDSSPDASLLLDPDGTVISCNRAVADEFGKSIREIVGRSLFDFMPADVAAAHRKHLEEARATGRTVRYRDEARGRIGDVVMVPIADEGGRLARVAVFVRDLTDLEDAQAALKRSELYFRSIIENALDVTAVLGPDGDVRFVNSAMERLSGYRPDELKGTRVFDFVHPEDKVLAKERFQRALEDGTRVEKLEFRFRHRDGSWRNVSATGSSLSPETGMQGVIVSARDITEHLQLEAQLRQALKMEAVGRLAGGVAHDFNNLLTVIQGYGELLSMSLADDPKRRESVGEIVKAAERAAALTRQLLAFSRRQILEMRVLDLGEVVTNAEKMLRRLIGEDIEVVVVKPAALGRVKADPGQIEQVLLNLAVNSRDAMPGGGRMTLELADLDLDAPLTTAHDSVPAGRYVVVSVSDTGIGMDAETFDHLFEPFFTTKEKGKGTGLGLATIFGIVKQSGGYVAVASAPGAGTTFRIFFPRAEEAAASNPVAIVAPARGTETVLLVEDEPSVRSLTRQLLEARGYRVLAADGSVSAIELAERHEGPIHLLLTDLVMPGLNGRRLAEAVTTRRPGIPVLFISGYSSDVLSREGLRRSSARFLQKPFTEASLARAVREALDKSQ